MSAIKPKNEISAALVPSQPYILNDGLLNRVVANEAAKLLAVDRLELRHLVASPPDIRK